MFNLFTSKKKQKQTFAIDKLSISQIIDALKLNHNDDFIESKLQALINCNCKTFIVDNFLFKYCGESKSYIVTKL